MSKRSTTNDNLTGQQWHDYRRAVDRLREARDEDGNTLYGWNDLSKLLGVSDRGFARAAYDSKHVCTLDALQAAEAEVQRLEAEGVFDRPDPNANGDHPPALKGKLTSNAQAYVNAIDELRNNFQATHDDISEALGSTSVKTTYPRLKRRDQTHVKDDTLADVLRLVKGCRRGDVPWMENGRPEPTPAPAETDEAPQQQPAEDAGAEGPTPAPASLDEVSAQLLSLTVEVGDRIDTIVDGLNAMRDDAPKMLRPGYDRMVEQLRAAATVFDDLLDEFE